MLVATTIVSVFTAITSTNLSIFKTFSTIKLYPRSDHDAQIPLKRHTQAPTKTIASSQRQRLFSSSLLERVAEHLAQPLHHVPYLRLKSTCARTTHTPHTRNNSTSYAYKLSETDRYKHPISRTGITKTQSTTSSSTTYSSRPPSLNASQNISHMLFTRFISESNQHARAHYTYYTQQFIDIIRVQVYHRDSCKLSIYLLNTSSTRL
ncbi:hypothetical protein BDZ45DRAFT_743657 [Acephala macrosclerotiorum]|nr:hypothetical protein BDZ45DRAFT_743657 [Acephala macrosclerotiorum]